MAKKNITDELRANFTAALVDFLSQEYDVDVCQTAAGTLMIPTVDSEGEGRWVKFSVIIPKEADEENGNDGYSLAREYQLKLDAAAERKARKESEAAARAEKAAARAQKKSEKTQN